MSAAPKVSVIVPVYNRESFLKECLDSLLNQTLKDIEIICVDDGSTDNSLMILSINSWFFTGANLPTFPNTISLSLIEYFSSKSFLFELLKITRFALWAFSSKAIWALSLFIKSCFVILRKIALSARIIIKL